MVKVALETVKAVLGMIIVHWEW